MFPSSSPHSPLPALGHAIGVRYRLEREAGPTEAGVVFEAVDQVARRRIAIEVASSIEEEPARTKWARDATKAQRLDGAHVLHVLDVGMLPDGTPYAVREIAVATLASEVEARGALPVQEAVGWTLEACEAIAEAHALGMAHGDLRLENVYLARGSDGMTVKVAWNTAAKAERATKEDVARDIAGLGSLLRVLVTGRFEHEAEGAPTLPSDIAAVIARSLAEHSEARFHNVGELARALAPWAPPDHRSARSVAFMLSRAGIVGGAIPLPAPACDPLGDEWFGRPSRRSLLPAFGPGSNKRGAAFALGSLALVGFVLGGAVFLWQSGKLPHRTGAAPREDMGTAPIVPSDEASGAPSEEPSPAPVETESTPPPASD